MQKMMKNPGKLLDERGQLAERGYATRLIKAYNREAIRAPKWRIKEWDYYLIASERYALALTIDDNGYMYLDSISFIDFDQPCESTFTKMGLFPMGKRGLPSTSVSGSVTAQGKDYRIQFENINGNRRLSGYADGFMQGKKLLFDITLKPNSGDSMVIATPFKENPKAFYYNQKINCLSASGSVLIGDEEYLFAPAHSYAVLDWGRGVWTYQNTWYWGSLSGEVDGKPFGFNIGYGFGDTSAASENMLFYDGKAHKLSQVTFHIPQKEGKDDYMQPWHFSSDDGRLTMTMTPIIDRHSNTDLGIIGSNQHQVFGRFSGEARLDDGRIIRFGNMIGFAEKVRNKW